MYGGGVGKRRRGEEEEEREKKKERLEVKVTALSNQTGERKEEKCCGAV